MGECHCLVICARSSGVVSGCHIHLKFDPYFKVEGGGGVT